MFVQRTKVLQISLIAILSAFVVELSFGLYTNSLALITDGTHALLDAVVTGVLLLAARMAMKPPDAEHTYGHGKIESLGGLFGGIAILLISGFFIYESIFRIQNPPEVLPSSFALIAGFYTIGIDIFRIILLRKTIVKIGGETLKADFYHAFMDLGSTLVAIIGIFLVTLGIYFGDFVAALILGVLLAFLSIKLIRRAANDLIDNISPDLVKNVRQIVSSTEDVIDVGPILMRKSGDTIFADITISVHADVSFDKAHEISHQVENNVKNAISNSKITVHFEPSWKDVPQDSKISEMVSSVKGVKNVHNISSYSSEGKSFVSLHVMVDRDTNFEEAHKISEIIEQKIQEHFTEIEHVTIHLEPFVTMPKNFKFEGKSTQENITKLISEYSEIKKVSRVVTLNFKDMFKIDIDCSFDKDLSIEKVHDLTSQIEQKLKGHFKNAVITIHPEPI